PDLQPGGPATPGRATCPRRSRSGRGESDLTDTIRELGLREPVAEQSRIAATLRDVLRGDPDRDAGELAELDRSAGERDDGPLRDRRGGLEVARLDVENVPQERGHFLRRDVEEPELVSRIHEDRGSSRVRVVLNLLGGDRGGLQNVAGDGGRAGGRREDRGQGLLICPLLVVLHLSAVERLDCRGVPEV